MRLGIQLYTFRKQINSLDSFKKVLEFVKSIGGESVEIAGIKGVCLKEMAQPLKEQDLVAAATHSSYERIKDDLDRLVEEHLNMGCKTIGISSMPAEFKKDKADGLKRFIDFVNLTSDKLKGSGIFLHYHNHAREFRGKEGDRIFDKMNVGFDKDVKFCLDAFWAYVAKCQPSVALDTFSDRIRLLHMKDYKKRIIFPKMVTPGEGIIDYPNLLRQADKYEVSDALIELDIAKDVYSDVKRGMEYLIKNYKKN